MGDPDNKAADILAKHAAANAFQTDSFWRSSRSEQTLQSTFAMSQCHGDLRTLVGSAFAWRRATGERETRWHKRGVSLVSGIIDGIMRHVCF